MIQHECWLNGAFPLLSCQLQLSDFILEAQSRRGGIDGGGGGSDARVSIVKGQLQDVPYSSELTRSAPALSQKKTGTPFCEFQGAGGGELMLHPLLCEYITQSFRLQVSVMCMLHPDV